MPAISVEVATAASVFYLALLLKSRKGKKKRKTWARPHGRALAIGHEGFARQRSISAGKPSNYRSRPHLRTVDGSLTFMPNVRGKVRADPLTALSIGRSSHHVHT
ncbi:hypothetical protein Pmani_003362 [Petrolisthes manimaculis]|uniref:Uncharacterized protein n=1 Tax=Petrolisthes manimaculis TaxID=1843537 RepID=A0AAE1QGU6_9EUCA|nr:hypothetical protein Pmani_003362 [Petrolisthes manimaculis]